MPNDRLVLFDTEVKDLDGEVPAVIQLDGVFKRLGRSVIVLGRGSPANPVDIRSILGMQHFCTINCKMNIRIIARKNGREIISRKHAEINQIYHKANANDFQKVGYMIKDIGALNGIYVNNRRIDTHILSSGDVIQFGGFYNLPIGEVLTVSDISVRYQFFSSSYPNDNGNDNGGNSSKIAISSSTANRVKRKQQTSNGHQDGSSSNSPTTILPIQKKSKSQENSTSSNSNTVVTNIERKTNSSGGNPSKGTILSVPPDDQSTSLLKKENLELEKICTELQKEIAKLRKSTQDSLQWKDEKVRKLSVDLISLQQNMKEKEQEIVTLNKELEEVRNTYNTTLNKTKLLETKEEELKNVCIRLT